MCIILYTDKQNNKTKMVSKYIREVKVALSMLARKIKRQHRVQNRKSKNNQAFETSTSTRNLFKYNCIDHEKDIEKNINIFQRQNII